MDFYNQPWFKTTMICSGSVAVGAGLVLIYDRVQRSFDLDKKSYEALKSLLQDATSDSPKFDGFKGVNFRTIKNKCKTNDKVVRLLDALETVRVLGAFEADTGIGITGTQKTLFEQAKKTARDLIDEKLAK